MAIDKISQLLGDKADYYLNHTSKTIDKSSLHSAGPGFIDNVFTQTNRNNQVLRSLQAIYGNGRLANTGYVSILPVDQGIEHSAGASFAPNPAFFDPENIIKLAIDGGCNAVASTYGVLAACSRKYAHKIPFIVKINHNEFISYPNKFDQIMFGSVEEAWNLGATAVGATIYFGSDESTRQIVEVAQAFERAHELGMATILRFQKRWC
jgi:class I fructose-bisphosphate aldolase